jgi:hypothetical protein
MGASRSESSYRRAEGRNWYTKYRSDDDTVHIMLNRAGDMTTGYPHLHVIFDRDNEIRLVITHGPYDHGEERTLPGNSTGNDVNALIEEMLRLL